MNCVLKLNALVFDNIIFKRLGMHSNNDLDISFSASIGTNMADKNIKKVSVKVIGEKADEYSFEVQASGFFAKKTLQKLTCEKWRGFNYGIIFI